MGKSQIYTVNGFTGNINEIAKHFGIKKNTLSYRLRKGVPIEEAVKKPARVTYTVDDFTGTIPKIAKHFGINTITLRKRLDTGMSLEEAINAPTSTIYTVNGFAGNLNQIAEHFNINKGTLKSRLKNGMSIEEAVSIPRQRIRTKDIKYNGEVGNLRYFCKKYDKDYIEVYNKLKHLHTLEYALESTTKPYQEE